MQPSFIAGLVLAIVAVVFSLQNASVVHIRFITWQFEASLALVLFVSFIVGLAASLLSMIPSRHRLKRMVQERDRRIMDLQEALLEAKDTDTETRFS